MSSPSKPAQPTIDDLAGIPVFSEDEPVDSEETRDEGATIGNADRLAGIPVCAEDRPAKKTEQS